MTTIDAGRLSLRTAPLDEMTSFSSMLTPGSERGFEPVARITARPASSVSVPAPPFTSTVRAFLSVPVPGTSVTLFFRNRNSTPLAIRSATPRLRCTACA